MDIYQLQVFSSVYRHRSFSKASEEMNLTQPSISMHVKRLEEELGIKLFDRMGRQSIPTKDADLLYTQSEELITKLKSIKNSFGKKADEAEGLLSIGTSTVPGTYMIPFVAADFCRRHPKVFFQLIVKGTKDIYAMIERGDLHVGLVEEKKEKEGIISLNTLSDEMVLVAAPGFIKKKSITPFGLLRVPLLMREEDSEARKSMEKYHLLHRISIKGLNVVAILGSTDSLKEAVKNGLGAAMMSRFAVKDDIKAGILEEISIKGVKMKRSLYLIANTHRTLPPLYQTFASFLRETIPSS